jgi:hypothetical protein
MDGVKLLARVTWHFLNLEIKNVEMLKIKIPFF